MLSLFEFEKSTIVCKQLSTCRHKNLFSFSLNLVKDRLNMVKVWFMDNEETDQRLEHHRNPPAYLELADLYKKTGVEYFKASEITLLNF